MRFQASDYGSGVAEILARRGDGNTPMDLAPRGPYSASDRPQLQNARDLFVGAACPEGAASGLWLYFGFLDQAHTIAQDLETPDGSYWHAIMHRQEPDAFNSGYWFRRVGQHSIFPALHRAARDLGYPVATRWEPLAFIDYCEEARVNPGSPQENLAKRVQLAEWQLLFDHCAKRKVSAR